MKTIDNAHVQDVAQTPVAETIDLASMSVEESYDGPHLEGQLALHRLPRVKV